ncbi:hypothetical protein V8C86DRAFT_2450739 [Haematococcus lacustris]
MARRPGPITASTRPATSFSSARSLLSSSSCREAELEGQGLLADTLDNTREEGSAAGGPPAAPVALALPQAVLLVPRPEAALPPSPPAPPPPSSRVAWACAASAAWRAARTLGCWSARGAAWPCVYESRAAAAWPSAHVLATMSMHSCSRDASTRPAMRASTVSTTTLCSMLSRCCATAAGRSHGGSRPRRKAALSATNSLTSRSSAGTLGVKGSSQPSLPPNGASPSPWPGPRPSLTPWAWPCC